MTISDAIMWVWIFMFGIYVHREFVKAKEDWDKGESE